MEANAHGMSVQVNQPKNRLDEPSDISGQSICVRVGRLNGGKFISGSPMSVRCPLFGHAIAFVTWQK